MVVRVIADLLNRHGKLKEAALQLSAKTGMPIRQARRIGQRFDLVGLRKAEEYLAAGETPDSAEYMLEHGMTLDSLSIRRRIWADVADAANAIGDLRCKNSARSPVLRCSINPVGPCEGCLHFEDRKS